LNASSGIPQAWKTAEEKVRTLGENGISAINYTVAAVNMPYNNNPQPAPIMNEIFDDIFPSADDKILLQGYISGHYMKNRAWEVGPMVNLEDKPVGEITEYQNACNKLGLSYTGGPNNYDVASLNLTALGAGNLNNNLKTIENKLVELGTATVCGKYRFENTTSTQSLIRAFVQQFGRDHQEFMAFVSDISARNLPAATTEYTITPATVAMGASADAVRLASVLAADANFTRSLVKVPDTENA
jgi:hypothetical protein